MTEYIIQILMGAIGAVGFAILYNVRGKQLLLFFLGGALAWAVYLICTHNGCNGFQGLLFATMTAAFTSEILARVCHTPVLILLVPMLIPLIPGGNLYYCMDALVRGERELCIYHATQAVTAAGAIVLGIVCVTAIMHIILRVQAHIVQQKEHK